jgi:hypothetical protein
MRELEELEKRAGYDEIAAGAENGHWAFVVGAPSRRVEVEAEIGAIARKEDEAVRTATERQATVAKIHLDHIDERRADTGIAVVGIDAKDLELAASTGAEVGQEYGIAPGEHDTQGPFGFRNASLARRTRDAVGA